jgi:hypothetical protein
VINDLAGRYGDAVIEDFYQHLLSFEDTRAFFSDPQVPAAGQELAEGIFPASDAKELRPRLHPEPGAIHERIVGAHRGKALAEPNPAGGSIFCFRVPADATEA